MRLRVRFAEGTREAASAAAPADTGYRPGDALPYDDYAAGAITIGADASALGPSDRVHLLLECRRVLAPRGVLTLQSAAIPEPPADELREFAVLLGFEPRAGVHGEFQKPERRVVGEPLVSIAIPASQPRYFQAAFESALAQTYRNVEIVVCDDSRDDDAIERVARAAHGRPVRYERNVERLKVRANFTRCLERSGGELVKFLCDDDWLAPNCVERLVDAFRRAPDVSLATSARRCIDEHGTPLADTPATTPILRDDALVAGYSLANAMLIAGLNTIGEPSTALFRRADFTPGPDCFSFRGNRAPGVIDMVMWSSLLLKGNAVYLCERLSAFRVHAGQRQHDPATQQRSFDSIRALQAAWLPLGIHERIDPDRLLAKRFPPEGIAWELRQNVGFAARRA